MMLIDESRPYHGFTGRLSPRALIDSELNLEVDEMRCLESTTATTTNTTSNSSSTKNDTNIANGSTSEERLASYSNSGMPLPR